MNEDHDLLDADSELLVRTHRYFRVQPLITVQLNRVNEWQSHPLFAATSQQNIDEVKSLLSGSDEYARNALENYNVRLQSKCLSM